MSFIGDIFGSIEKTLWGAVKDGVNSAIASASPNNKTPGRDLIPGDIEILKINLTNEAGTKHYDLMHQVKGIEIYESILSPVIFCELTVQDSINLHQSFPIIGEEYVTITFKTPKHATNAKYLFRVNKKHNLKIFENNKMATYSLQLMSAEVVKNSTRYVTKKYENTVDNVIKQILAEELKTVKAIRVDKTVGIEKGRITRMQPFKAIDFLRRRAISSEYKSSSFCFFENRNGYFFTTIEKMIDDGNKSLDKAKTSSKSFYFDTNRKTKMENVTVRNILAYNQIAFTDTVTKLQQGGIKNKVNSFDLLTGNIEQKVYDNAVGERVFKKVEDSAQPMNTSSFINNHKESTAKTKFVVMTSDKPQLQLPEKLSILQAYAQKITQNIVQIHIYGDSDIVAGDMIKCQFPSTESSDKTKGVSRLDSGNYLVAKVRHMITNGDRPQHTMALELIKGSLTEAP